ncbi:hypothetical protein [Ornithinibacillus salinisoli]
MDASYDISLVVTITQDGFQLLLVEAKEKGASLQANTLLTPYQV